MGITRLSNEPYPATEVIKYLIDTVGHDVMSFRRNTQVSYMLVDRARDICDAINGYIQRTEGGEDWMSFDKFTNAIDPVEELLFQLIAYTEDERALHLTTGSSVEDCVSSTEHWAANREQLWTALADLETKEELAELFAELDTSSREVDRLEAQRQDDKTFFEEIVADIKEALKQFKRLPGAIRNVETNLDRLLTKMATGSVLPWLAVYVVKTGLLVQGIVNLFLPSAPIDTATRNHLRSRFVWECAEELADILNSTIGDDKVSRDKVRLKFDAFIRILRNTTDIPTPKSYIELMKQAGRVRRPFQAQALAIILLCRNLVTAFAHEARHTADNALILEDTCDETLKALKVVVAAVAELKIFDTSNLEDNAAYKALLVAQDHIRGCFAAFGLEGIWSEKERLIADAVRKDKERMDELNKLLETRPPLTIRERAAQVKVTATVCYPSEEGEGVAGNVIVSAEGSALLSAVRWTVAGALDPAFARIARQTGEFILLPEDKTVELNRTVSEFANSSNECTFKFLVRL